MYSAPACFIIKKQRVDGLTADTSSFQDADFAFWVGIVKAPAIQPGRRPTAGILVG